jgi:hypothetical protein
MRIASWLGRWKSEKLLKLLVGGSLLDECLYLPAQYVLSNFWVGALVELLGGRYQIARLVLTPWWCLPNYVGPGKKEDKEAEKRGRKKLRYPSTKLFVDHQRCNGSL